MVKFVKKHKPNLEKTSVKKFSPKAKAKKPLLRKTWKPKEGVAATNPLKIEEVTSSVNALLQVIKKKKEENKKSLFKDDSQEIMLQVQAIKVPDTPKLQLRTNLPHSLATGNADLCFITEDVKGSSKDNHEPTIAHYKELFEKENITNKIEIVPIRQLRSDYVTYEAKGRFASLYDLYLVDGRLLGKVTKIVGSRFFKKHKLLIPVKVNTSRFKIEMEKALAKTSMMIHGNGDSYTVQVGYSHFRAEELVANICAVATMLANRFPGGFANIRRMLVKSKYSMAIPIYISLTPANEVPVPVVLPHLPKAYKAVEGELTTVLGGHVKVHPTGRVEFKRVFTKEDEEMGVTRHPTRAAHSRSAQEDDSDDVPDDDSDSMEDEVSTVMGNKLSMENKEVSSDDDEEDEDVETAEDAYMRELQERPKQEPPGQKTNIKGKKKAKANTSLGKKKSGLSETPTRAKAGSEDGSLKKKLKKKQKVDTSTSPLKMFTPGGKRKETPDNKKKQMKNGDTPGIGGAESQKKSVVKKMKQDSSPDGTPNKPLSNKMLKKGCSSGESLNKTPGGKKQKLMTLGQTPASQVLRTGSTPGSKKKTPGSKMQKTSGTPESNDIQLTHKTAGNKIQTKVGTPVNKNDESPNKMKLKRNTPGNKVVDAPNRTGTPGSKKGRKSMSIVTPDSQSTETFMAKLTSVGSVKGKSPKSSESLTPKNAMKFTEEITPVTKKSSEGKKQMKKSRLSLVSSVDVATPSPQKSGKRRESSSITPKPKKMKGVNALNVSAKHKNTPVNKEVHSAKSLKNKPSEKDQKSAKKRKSAIFDKGESGDGSFTRYFSKENQQGTSP